MGMRAPGKKETLRAWLARGVAMVHLDARRPGVVVPPQYAGDAHLRLNLSYRYSIPDLEVGDDSVQATLSFGGRPFHCVLPWEAIFGITSQASGDGQVWPEDLPVEVVQTFAERHAQVPREEGLPTPSGNAPARARPSLAPIEGELKEGEAQEPKAEDGAPRRHLRLVR
ncbi:MAG TPA: ClpXP protease specificity-enhancing factor SspB [Myxococcales bacterium]